MSIIRSCCIVVYNPTDVYCITAIAIIAVVVWLRQTCHYVLLINGDQKLTFTTRSRHATFRILTELKWLLLLYDPCC